MIETREIPKTLASPKFSGHETFALRHGWLKKAVDAVFAKPDFFRDENEALVLKQA